MSVWMVFAAVGIGTYALRVSMFLALGRWSIPTRFERSMELMGPAALAALVTSMVLISDGRFAVPSAPVAAAVVVGFLVTRRTGDVLHALLAGLPVFWLVTALGW